MTSEEQKALQIIKEAIVKGFFKENLKPGVAPITADTQIESLDDLLGRELELSLDGTVELQSMVKNLTKEALKKEAVKKIVTVGGVSEQEAFMTMLIAIKNAYPDPIKAFIYLSFYKDNWDEVLETAKIGIERDDKTIEKYSLDDKDAFGNFDDTKKEVVSPKMIEQKVDKKKVTFH